MVAVIVPSVIDEAPAQPRGRQVLSPPRLTGWDLLAIGVLVVYSFLAVGLHVATFTQISPIDELSHMDYVFRSPTLIRDGDMIGQEAMREQACRGQENWPVPACGLPSFSAPDFPGSGFNTAGINTPVYYTLTKVTTVVIDAVLPLDSRLTAARLSGGLWLAVGVGLIYVAARRWGAGRAPATAMLLIAISTPFILFHAATVSPDQMLLLAGGLVLLTASWVDESPRRRWWALALVCVFVVTLKMTHAAVSLAILVWLVLRWWHSRNRVDGSRDLASLKLAGVVAVSTIVPIVGWALVRSQIAITGSEDLPMNTIFAVDSFPLASLIKSTGALLEPLASPVLVVGGDWTWTAQRIGALTIPVGVFAAVLLGARETLLTLLSRATLYALILLGAGLIVLQYVLDGWYFPLPVRYGATTLAIMLVATASQVKRREPTVILVAAALFAVAVTIVRLT